MCGRVHRRASICVVNEPLTPRKEIAGYRLVFRAFGEPSYLCRKGDFMRETGSLTEPRTLSQTGHEENRGVAKTAEGGREGIPSDVAKCSRQRSMEMGA